MIGPIEGVPQRVIDAINQYQLASANVAANWGKKPDEALPTWAGTLAPYPFGTKTLREATADLEKVLVEEFALRSGMTLVKTEVLIATLGPAVYGGTDRVREWAEWEERREVLLRNAGVDNDLFDRTDFWGWMGS